MHAVCACIDSQHIWPGAGVALLLARLWPLCRLVWCVVCSFLLLFLALSFVRLPQTDKLTSLHSRFT